jgi:hypothetical protein
MNARPAGTPAPVTSSQPGAERSPCLPVSHMYSVSGHSAPADGPRGDQVAADAGCTSRSAPVPISA